MSERATHFSLCDKGTLSVLIQNYSKGGSVDWIRERASRPESDGSKNRESEQKTMKPNRATPEKESSLGG